MSSTKSNVTPADVAKKQGEESNAQVDQIIADTKLVAAKKTIPVQTDGESVPENDTNVELIVIEGGKKTFKERVVSLTGMLKEHKKVVAATLITVGAVAVAVAKYTASQNDEMPSEDEAELKDAQDQSEQIADLA